MSEPTTPVDLAVVVTGNYGSDLLGGLFAPTGEVLYSHVSSSIGWLKADLTNNFGRRAELDAKYPQGWTVSVYNDNPPPDALIKANITFYANKETDGEAT